MDNNNNEVPDNVAQAMYDINETYAEGIRDQLGLDDTWQYRPLPWMDEAFYDKFVSIVGEDNMKIVSGTKRQGEVDGEIKTAVRASVFLNETAIENLRNYSAVQTS